MGNVVWQKTVGRLVKAVWVYSLAAVASCVFRAMGEWEWMREALPVYMRYTEFQTTLIMGSFEGVCGLLVFAGYYLFVRGVARFAALQGDGGERECVRSVGAGYGVLMAGVLLSYLPVAGRWLWVVAVAVAAVRLWRGLEGLRRSSVWPEAARRGAAVLRWCVVGSVVGAVAGMIPEAGVALEAGISLAVFVGSLIGWGRIRRNEPQVADGGSEWSARMEEERPTRMLLGCLAWMLALGWLSAVDLLGCGVMGESGVEKISGQLVAGQGWGVLICWIYASCRSRRMRLGFAVEGGFVVLVVLQMLSWGFSFVATFPFSMMLPFFPLVSYGIWAKLFAGRWVVLWAAGMALLLCRSRLPLRLKVGVPCLGVAGFVAWWVAKWMMPDFFVGIEEGDLLRMQAVWCGGVSAVCIAVSCFWLRRWEREAFPRY